MKTAIVGIVIAFAIGIAAYFGFRPKANRQSDKVRIKEQAKHAYTKAHDFVDKLASTEKPATEAKASAA